MAEPGAAVAVDNSRKTALEELGNPMEIDAPAVGQPPPPPAAAPAAPVVPPSENANPVPAAPPQQS